MLGKQALEHELVRSAAAQPDVGSSVMHDLVVCTIEFRGQTCIAESGQGIGGDGYFAVLPDNDKCGHETESALALSNRRGRSNAGMRAIIPR